MNKKKMLINKINENAELICNYMATDKTYNAKEMDYALIDSLRKEAVKEIKNGSEEFIEEMYEKIIGGRESWTRSEPCAL